VTILDKPVTIPKSAVTIPERVVTMGRNTQWIPADKIRAVTQALAADGLSPERHRSEHGRAMGLLTLIL
jgi:hypothetical protein